MDSDSDSSSNNEEPIAKRKINFRINFSHNAHATCEAGAWRTCARRARGMGALGGVAVKSMAQVYVRNYGLTQPYHCTFSNIRPKHTSLIRLIRSI